MTSEKRHLHARLGYQHIAPADRDGGGDRATVSDRTGAETGPYRQDRVRQRFSSVPLSTSTVRLPEAAKRTTCSPRST